jgi:hypothetical protein
MAVRGARVGLLVSLCLLVAAICGGDTRADTTNIEIPIESRILVVNFDRSDLSFYPLSPVLDGMKFTRKKIDGQKVGRLKTKADGGSGRIDLDRTLGGPFRAKLSASFDGTTGLGEGSALIVTLDRVHDGIIADTYEIQVTYEGGAGLRATAYAGGMPAGVTVDFPPETFVDIGFERTPAELLFVVREAGGGPWDVLHQMGVAPEFEFGLSFGMDRVAKGAKGLFEDLIVDGDVANGSLETPLMQQVETLRTDELVAMDALNLATPDLVTATALVEGSISVLQNLRLEVEDLGGAGTLQGSTRWADALRVIDKAVRYDQKALGKIQKERPGKAAKMLRKAVSQKVRLLLLLSGLAARKGGDPEDCYLVRFPL